MRAGFFIDRPVFSTVISVLIVLVGLIGLISLPIEQYPQITPPVVKVSASYPGANALTVSQAVATPLFESRLGCGRDTEPREAGRKPFAGRGYPERYFNREAIAQPVDDAYVDV